MISDDTGRKWSSDDQGLNTRPTDRVALTNDWNTNINPRYWRNRQMKMTASPCCCGRLVWLSTISKLITRTRTGLIHSEDDVSVDGYKNAVTIWLPVVERNSATLNSETGPVWRLFTNSWTFLDLIPGHSPQHPQPPRKRQCRARAGTAISWSTRRWSVELTPACSPTTAKQTTWARACGSAAANRAATWRSWSRTTATQCPARRKGSASPGGLAPLTTAHELPLLGSSKVCVLSNWYF